ncbi:MAG: ATP-binding protein, partial [Bacteroidota bacterium]
DNAAEEIDPLSGVILPENPDDLKDLIKQLIQENNSMRDYYNDHSLKLFEQIGMLSWDYTAGAKVPEEYLNGPFSDIFTALGTIQEDINNLIEEREKHILEISETGLKYQTLFESANDAILILDGDRIIESNKVAHELFRIDKQELIGKSILDLSPKNHAGEKRDNELMMSLSTAAIIKKTSFEWIFTYPDGNIFYTDVSFNKVTIREKEYTQAMIRDITQRKKSEEELERYRFQLEELVRKRTEDLDNARQKAEEADRLKTSFLANMSHEMRTPMNVIIGFADMLNDANIPDTRRQEYISLINNSSSHLLRLIDDIIDMAKIEANQLIIEMAPCNAEALMNDLFVQYSGLIRQLGKQDVEFISETKNGSGTEIITDISRLRQILTNLLDNSLKFTEKGSIRFGCQVTETGMVEFHVIDTGIGFSSHDLEMVFERFRQGDDSVTKEYGGAGLGLTIAKNLVEILGGKLTVHSEKGKGSEFRFSLPLAGNDLRAVRSDKAQETGKEHNWEGKIVLIVEDEDTNYRFLHETLDREGVILIRAIDGKTACDLVQERDDIDLVLMDIQLPVMNGYVATAKIKSMKPGQLVIAQTAYAMADEKKKCFEAGCDDYIAKPIRRKVLFSLLEKYL